MKYNFVLYFTKSKFNITRIYSDVSDNEITKIPSGLFNVTANNTLELEAL